MESSKKTAKELFNKKEYLKAIDQLHEIGINGFVTFAKKANKKEKKHSWFKTAGFYNSLLNRPKLFTELFGRKEADEILHEYYSSKIFIPEFEKNLSHEFPKLFVNSVRVNVAFVDHERAEFYSKLTLPRELKGHQKLWIHLAKKDSDIWSVIENYFIQLSKCDLELDEIFSNLVKYLEELRFNNNSNKTVNHLASVYNLFIEAYLIEYRKNSKLSSTSSVDFQEKFIKGLTSPVNSQIRNLLNQISSWVDFRDSILYPYCYDLKITPSELNEIIHFSRTPKNFYKWELDGIRYNFNKLNYQFKGTEIVEYLIENKSLHIPKGKSGQDEEGNYQLAIQDWQLRLFLDDLKLNNFIFEGNKINPQTLFAPLITYSKNRNLRYEQGLVKYSDKSGDWLEAFSLLTLDALRQDVEILPYFLMSEKEYIEHNNISIPNLPKNSSEDIVNLFTYSSKSRKYFNRFNIGYNVWSTPFVSAGDFLFCPMMFFANNDWFYGFAQAGLENLNKCSSKKERVESASEMEQHLGELLCKKNWKVHVVTQKEASEIDGDVDVIVSDGKEYLLLQLKRTKFRLNLKEAYYESIIVDRKAVQQLNDAKNYLTMDNDIFKIEGPSQKWIVTTSFENVLTQKEGCLKVNYFDLINALNNPEIKTINSLTSYIKQDKGLKNWLAALQQKDVSFEMKHLIKESGLPVSLAEPKAYNQAISAGNNVFKEYHSRFNKALELGEKNKIGQAIKILITCTIDQPNDYDAWGALANYYADIKDYKNSLKCFEKALEIIPNDPYMKRNYAITHRESGNIKKTIEIYNEILNDYWFLNLN